MYRVRPFVFCLVMVLFCGAVAGATTIIPSTLDDMTQVSDTILTGVVSGRQSYWEDNLIYTKLTITVQRFEKNIHRETAPTIEVKILGGQVGDVRCEVDQAPRFESDQKVMLFLKKIRGAYAIFGFNYGAYKIKWDPLSQQEVIDGPLFRQANHMRLPSMQKQANLDFRGPQALPAFLIQLRNRIKH